MAPYTLDGRANTLNIHASTLFQSRGSTFNPEDGRNVSLSYCGKHLSNYMFHFWENQNTIHRHGNLIVQVNSVDIITHYFSTYCLLCWSPNLRLDKRFSRLRFCTFYLLSAMCVEFHCPLFAFCNILLPLSRYLSIHSSCNLFSKIKTRRRFQKGYFFLKPSVLSPKQKNAPGEKAIFIYNRFLYIYIY